MIQIDPAKCIGCGSCAADCFSRSIAVTDGNAHIVKESCMRCGHCVAICPTGAVYFDDYGMDEVESLETLTRPAPEEVLYRIKARRTIRNFSAKPVEEDAIRMLLQAGRYSPTARNSEGNRFFVIRNGLSEFQEMTWNFIDSITPADTNDSPANMRPFFIFNKWRKANPENDYLFRNAPLILMIANERELDAGLAAANMEAMANALGLGVMYNGFLRRITQMDEPAVNWLGAQGVPLQAVLMLGYPAVSYQRTAPRKPVNCRRL